MSDHKRCKACGRIEETTLRQECEARMAIEKPSKTGVAIGWDITDNQVHTGRLAPTFE